MIPFTNQMRIKSDLLENGDLVYEIKSGKIDTFKINFYKNYNEGINFGCGVGRALKYSGYNFLMGVNLNMDL